MEQYFFDDGCVKNDHLLPTKSVEYVWKYFQEISDAELTSTLQDIGQNFPAIGEIIVLGHLRHMGYRVNRDRVRRAMRTIVPNSSALRGLRVITARRPYSVPGPNSLWHIGMLIDFFVIIIC